MFTPSRRAAGVSMIVLALACWNVPGPAAFAKGGGGGGGGHGGGGGGHGGGGHGGGGHSSGGHSGGHSGGYHSGGYYHGGQHPVYYGGFGYYPRFYYGGYGYNSGYGYGYYNSGYSYPYYNNYGYSDPSYSSTPVYVMQAPAGAYQDPSQGRYLGIDEVPVVDGGATGMQVRRVYPGSPAEQAGLQVGDVIFSANGYLTQDPGNLPWIIANTPANGVLQMNVRTAKDGAIHAVNAQSP
jgi:hypothetical protein